MAMRPAAAALLALGLAGCMTAGPEYKLPDTAVSAMPAAKGAFVDGQGPAFSSAALPAAWWRLYGDARLDGFVAEALKANTDLRAADANLRRADAVVSEVMAARTVQTDIGGGGGLARPYGTGGTLPGTLGYNLSIGLAYPLDLAGRLRRAIEASKADAETVEAVRDALRVTVAAETARSYATACLANLTLDANARVLTLQQQTLDVTRRLQRGGRGTAFDVTRAQAAVSQNEAAIPAIVAVRTAALYRLAALMGRPPAEFPRDVVGRRVAPGLKRPLPVGDGAALIQRRPDLRAAERAFAAATARIGVATAGLYPEVSFGGSVGAMGPVASFGSGGAFDVSLGPLIQWHFPNRRAVRSQIAGAQAGADAAFAQFDSTVIEALRQAETALSTYAGERGRNAALVSAHSNAATAADQAGRLYRFGRTDFLALLNAQAVLANAEAGLATSDAQLVDSQINVFKALGGGWQNP